MKHVVLLSLCFLYFVAVATAQNTTGNDLRQKCSDLFKSTVPYTGKPADEINIGYCAGYLDAVVEVEMSWRIADARRTSEPKVEAAHFCLPSGVTSGQVQSVVGKWMNEHPEELHHSADSIIRQALIQAFPCK